MPAVVLDLLIDAHASFVATVQLFGADDEHLDLTGYTARASVKRHYEDEAPLAVFVCAVDGAGGTVSFDLDNAEAAKLQPVVTPCVWDLWLTDGAGVSQPILRGNVQVIRAVTE